MNKYIIIITLFLTIFITHQNIIANPENQDSDKSPDNNLSSSCCVDVRGNVNADENDQTDIVDLVFLINYFYDEGPGTTCFEESDINRSGAVDIGDIVYLVNYMFNNGPAPFNCHSIGQD